MDAVRREFLRHNSTIRVRRLQASKKLRKLRVSAKLSKRLDTIPSTWQFLAMNEVIQDQVPIHHADSRVDPLPFPSVTAWLRVFWMGILFPGVPAKSERWRWTSLLMLLAITSTLLFPCLSFYLFEPDEGRYAQIPREML